MEAQVPGGSFVNFTTTKQEQVVGARLPERLRIVDRPAPQRAVVVLADAAHEPRDIAALERALTASQEP